MVILNSFIAASIFFEFFMLSLVPKPHDGRCNYVTWVELLKSDCLYYMLLGSVSEKH